MHIECGKLFSPQMVDLSKDKRGSLHIPDYYAEKVTDIDFRLLHEEQGIRHAIFDFDGTLVPAGMSMVNSKIRNYLEWVMENGFLDGMCLASNSRRVEVEKSARLLGADNVRSGFLIRKPSELFFSRVIQKIGCKPEETVMVGDKITIDVAGARKAGIKTVLVNQMGLPFWRDELPGVLLGETQRRKELQEVLRSK